MADLRASRWSPGRWRVALGLIVVATIAVRVLLIVALAPSSPVGDMGLYIELAKGIAPVNDPENTYRAPAYPVLLRLTLAAVDDPIAAGCILNVFFSVLAVACVGCAGRRLLGDGCGLGAAALLAVEPTFSAYSTMVLTEVMSVALSAAALLALARVAGWRCAALAGICLGLGALTRDCLVLFIPLAIVVAWRGAGRRPALIVGVAAACVILPWTVRNALATGHLIPISTSSGYNLLVGNNPYADGSQRCGKRIFQVADPPVPEDMDVVERHLRATRYARSWISHHPVRFVMKGIRGAERMFGLDRQFLYELREGYYARRAPRVVLLGIAAATMGAWVLMLPLALLGVAGSGGRLRQLGATALLWTVLTGALTFGEYRFRMPMQPVFVLLAVEGVRVWRGRKVRRRSLVAAGVAMVPILVFWTREVVDRAGEVM